MRFTTFLFKNLLRRKMRSLLTCGGVAVAVGATIAFLGIADGFERSMAESFVSKGTDIIIAEKSKLDPLSGDLDENYAERIAVVEGVDQVAPGLLEMIGHEIDGDTVPLLVLGWRVDSFLMKSLDILKGRPLGLDDKRRLVMGVDLAESLELDVGDEFVLEEIPCEVIAIFRSQSEQENRAIVLPIDELQDVMLRPDGTTGFSVTVVDDSDAALVQRVCDDINALRSEDGRSLKLAAEPTRSYVQNLQVIQIAKGMAWLTSAIAILVGAIGMLNTMIMSVVERIKEISILRAIGWRKSRVMSMIVGESLMISMAGAMAGAIGAVLITQWLTTLPQAAMMEGDISWPVIAQGFCLAAGVGLAGGAYPAFRATRLLPSEGLRHE